ncbi:MAG: hypothetical protein LQ339_003380 [Xanthoria mediterranea]|nr:MAG: hypothetical protein LQ339_003380 [Xanthoria mediterranea]
MPKDLAKVQKKIHKKKGAATSLHENSRDAKRLRRAGARSDKLDKLATARAKALQPYLQRISFFQSAAQEEGASGPFTIESMQALIEIYLDRDAHELSTIQSQRRPGRPPSTAEDTLKQRIEVEAKEYRSGYWIPDMADVENLGRLKGWNEQWTGLGMLKYVRIARDGSRHVSSFPPKGKS